MFGSMRQFWIDSNSVTAPLYWIANFPVATSEESTLSLVTDSSNNIYLGGYDVLNTSTETCSMMKLNINGNVQYANDYAVTISGSLDSGDNIVDTVTDGSGNFYSITQEGLFIKSDSSGSIIFANQWKYSIAVSANSHLVMMPNGNIAVTLETTLSGYAAAVLVVFNSSGSVVWSNYVQAAYGSAPGAVGVDSSNNLYFGVNSYYGSSASNPQVNLIKYNSSGTLQWQKNINSSPTSSTIGIYDLITDSSGNSYFSLEDSSTSPTNNILMKVDSSGNLIFSSKLSVGSSTQTLQLQQLRFDNSGNIYMSGDFNDSSTGKTNAIVVKYDTSGVLQWQNSMAITVSGSSVSAYGEGLGFNTKNNLIWSIATSSSTNSLSALCIDSNGGALGTYQVGTNVYTYTASSFTTSSASLNYGSSSINNNSISGTVTAGSTSTTANTLTENINYISGTPVATSYSVSYLLVAGGGGGGYSAGGGAGGLLTGTQTLNTGTTYSFTVGAGGPGGINVSASSLNGGNSTAFSLTAFGGGGGASRDINGYGASGGSGGGGAGSGNAATLPGAGTSGQGYSGGSGTGELGGDSAGGGGGGATAVGGNGSADTGGVGGAGAQWTIDSNYYAGGGGGSGLYDPHGTSSGAGGVGGGGNGGGGYSTGGGIPGYPATANTGGGGGGGSGGSSGGNGGSGIVAIAVPTSFYSGVTTGSPTVTVIGSNTVLYFNSSGSYTA